MALRHQLSNGYEVDHQHAWSSLDEGLLAMGILIEDLNTDQLQHILENPDCLTDVDIRDSLRTEVYGGPSRMPLPTSGCGVGIDSESTIERRQFLVERFVHMQAVQEFQLNTCKLNDVGQGLGQQQVILKLLQ